MTDETNAPPRGSAPDARVAPPLDAIAASLRRERARAGISLSELAQRAGIAKSTLSQLESGNGNPSIETLWALCTALDITFGRLIEPPRRRVQVIRSGEGPALASSESTYRATLLAVSPASARADVFRVVAEPGPGRVSEPHMDGLVEHVMLGAGRALVGAVDDPVELEPGDYVSYPGDEPHIFQALEPGTLAVLIQEQT